MLIRNALSLLLLGGLVCVGASAQELSFDEISTITDCLHTSKHDMLGPRFEVGKNFGVTYLFIRDGAERKDRFLYLAYIAPGAASGRFFQVLKREGRWNVTNDVNFALKPRWRFTSDPLGGIFTQSLMSQALRRVEQAGKSTELILGPAGRQPDGCGTYYNAPSAPK